MVQRISLWYRLGTYVVILPQRSFADSEPCPSPKPAALRKELGADQQQVVGIHGQDMNGDAADGGAADDASALPSEVLRPSIPARMKQADGFAGGGVNSGDVRAFEAIAVRAGERQELFATLWPPCFPATMWSIWKGSGSAKLGMRQYSQRSAARRQTVRSSSRLTVG